MCKLRDNAGEITEVIVLRNLLGSIRHYSAPLRWPLGHRRIGNVS